VKDFSSCCYFSRSVNFVVWRPVEKNGSVLRVRMLNTKHAIGETIFAIICTQNPCKQLCVWFARVVSECLGTVSDT